MERNDMLNYMAPTQKLANEIAIIAKRFVTFTLQEDLSHSRKNIVVLGLQVLENVCDEILVKQS